MMGAEQAQDSTEPHLVHCGRCWTTEGLARPCTRCDRAERVVGWLIVTSCTGSGHGRHEPFRVMGCYHSRLVCIFLTRTSPLALGLLVAPTRARAGLGIFILHCLTVELVPGGVAVAMRPRCGTLVGAGMGLFSTMITLFYKSTRPVSSVVLTLEEHSKKEIVPSHCTLDIF